MSVEHDITLTWNGGGGVNPAAATAAHTAATEGNIDDVIPAGTTDKQYDVAITKATMQSLFVLASQGVTVKVNSNTAPDETWVLAASVPFVWLIDWAAWFANPLAADVTKFFVTNPGTSSARFQLRSIS